MTFKEWKNILALTFPYQQMAVFSHGFVAEIHFDALRCGLDECLTLKCQIQLEPGEILSERRVHAVTWILDDGYTRTLILCQNEPMFSFCPVSEDLEEITTVSDENYRDAWSRRRNCVEILAKKLLAGIKAYRQNNVHPVSTKEIEFSDLPESSSDRWSGQPWMITVDYVPDQCVHCSLDEIKTFCLCLREQETGKLIVDFPNIPVEIKPECVNVLEQAILFCRQCGPEGSEWDRVYLWDDEQKEIFMFKNTESYDIKCLHFSAKQLLKSLRK